MTLKAATISRTGNHLDNKSTECVFLKINSTTVKMTYQAYNAAETCKAEILSGEALNYLLSMEEAGVVANKSAYNILNKEERAKRAEMIFTQMFKVLVTIL